MRTVKLVVKKKLSSVCSRITPVFFRHMTSPAYDLLSELSQIHEHKIFSGLYESITWEDVNAYECSLTRDKTGTIHLNSTAFWACDRNGQRGVGLLEFGDDSAILGRGITQAAFTQACGKSGETSITIGFSPVAPPTRNKVGQRLLRMDRIGDTRPVRQPSGEKKRKRKR